MQQLSSAKLGVHRTMSGLAQACRTECSVQWNTGSWTSRSSCMLRPAASMSRRLAAGPGKTGGTYGETLCSCVVREQLSCRFFFFFLCWEMRDCGRLIVPSILFSFLFDGNEDGPWWACPALGLSVERQAAIVGGRWRDLVSCAKFSGEANEWARRGRRTKNWRWVGVCG